MKKLLSLVLVAVLALSALTSCGKKEKFDMSSVQTLADLKGATIAAQTGTFHLDALTEQTKKVKVREYPDFTQLLTALKAGTIDGYVAEEPTAYAVIAQNPDLAYVALKNNDTGFTATDSDTGIAVGFKSDSPYVAQVNAILSSISEETRQKLMQQAVAMNANQDTALSEPLALVSSNTGTANGTLKIAMECAYAPFNWAQSTDANGAVKIANSDFYANGYDVQIAKYIAAELGMALEIYEAEWDSLIPGVKSGLYDGIIAGMSPTAEREEVIDFTVCYYNSNLVIIYKK